MHEAQVYLVVIAGYGWRGLQTSAQRRQFARGARPPDSAAYARDVTPVQAARRPVHVQRDRVREVVRDERTVRGARRGARQRHAPDVVPVCEDQRRLYVCNNQPTTGKQLQSSGPEHGCYPIA